MTRSITDIVEQQMRRWQHEQTLMKKMTEKRSIPSPVITISRLLGSGGSRIAAELSRRMECEMVGIRIVDEIIRRSEVRKELVDAIDETNRSEITAWIEKLIHGQTLDGGDQLRFHLEAINYFISLGNVVMLGRGAAFVPRLRPRLDIRVVASVENRIDEVARRKQCNGAVAAMEINASDTQRARFVKNLFGRDWWDAREYDLVINTDQMSVDSAVTVIESAWHNYAARHLIREAVSMHA